MRNPFLSSPQRFCSTILLVLGVLLIAGASSAHAATRTWSGTNSGSWSDPGNWDAAPVANDDLVFPGGATIANSVTTNDFPAGTHFRSITIGGPYTLGGNAIVLDAGGLQFINLGFPNFSDTISLAITLGMDQSWINVTQFSNAPTIAGATDLNGHTLTIDTKYLIDIPGVISGAGAIVKAGAAQVTFNGANTYAGPTTVNDGILRVNTPTGLGVADGTPANGTTVNLPGGLTFGLVAIGNEVIVANGVPTAAVVVDGATSIAGPITITGRVQIGSLGGLTLPNVVSGPGRLIASGLVLTNGANSFTGGVEAHGLTIATDHALPGTPDISDGYFALDHAAQTIGRLTGSSSTVTVPAGSTLTFGGDQSTVYEGTLRGDGRIDYAGPGQWTLGFTVIHAPGWPQTPPYPNTFSGQFNVVHGTVILSGPAVLPASIITVGNDGRFAFKSDSAVNLPETGPITVNGGHLQLSGGTFPQKGVMGTLIMESASTLDVGGWDTNGFPGSTLSQLVVNGGVTLGDATLALQIPANFNPVPGDVLTIIDNDGTDPVSGTFKGLPEGAVIQAGGQRFRITYVGGTGNDVVLTLADYLLTEGATSDFFTTDLLLANPNDVQAPVHITFSNIAGVKTPLDVTLPAKSQKLIRVNDVPGMAGQEFSTVVHSVDMLPLVVERTMSWNRSSYGAHTEHAALGTASQWFFAEGSQGFFHTYLLLANPRSTGNTATVQYLREFEPPLTRQYTLGPTSRLTVDAAAEPELNNRSFGITVTFDAPGAAERAMYFGDAPLFNGGHESAGVTAPSTTWFLAEGATGPFFETFILLANPGDIDAEATLTYLPLFGAPVTVKKTVPAGRRVTVNIEQEDPSLANAAVSTQVVSTQPILVERAQYWPDPAPNWYEAHNSSGLTSLGTKWGLAEGRVGNVDGFTNAQTYILLANPGTVEASVQITFLRDNGATPVTKTFVVPPARRFNVRVAADGGDVPELSDEHFGAIVTSDQPIAVERAVYWDANGQVWAAGTNATATPIP
jgi:autotransporter-associated beta strand protein